MKASRDWTAADEARYEAGIDRIKAMCGDPHELHDVYCAHCGDFARPAVGCPGCGAQVCTDCYEARRGFAAQSCKERRHGTR